MKELGINEDIQVNVERRTISFDEDVTQGPLSDKFPDRKRQQNLNLYIMRSPNQLDNKLPHTLFSHGGAIRPDTSLKSPFLPFIQAQAEDQWKSNSCGNDRPSRIEF